MNFAQGAETPVFLASSPDTQELSGRYFANRREAPADSRTGDRELRRGLWELSERLTGLKP